MKKDTEKSNVSDLRKLSRSELLDLLLGQSLEIDRLTSEVDKLTAELALLSKDGDRESFMKSREEALSAQLDKLDTMLTAHERAMGEIVHDLDAVRSALKDTDAATAAVENVPAVVAENAAAASTADGSANATVDAERKVATADATTQAVSTKRSARAARAAAEALPDPAAAQTAKEAGSRFRLPSIFKRIPLSSSPMTTAAIRLLAKHAK